MKLCIGIVCDLRSEYLAAGYSEEDVAEFDSDSAVEKLEKGIRSLGYKVERIGNAWALCEKLVAGKRWDLVFNVAEGLRGRARESQVPCILELYGIPYTMSDPIVNGIGLDKALTKKIVGAAGLNTARFAVVTSPADIKKIKLKYPLFAKPIAEGTGKGIDGKSMIETSRQLARVCGELLRRLGQPVLVEEFLPGREFTVGITGTGSDAEVLGTMEIHVNPARKGAIYSYETKENYHDHVKYSTPAKGRMRTAVEKLALGAYLALECRDCSRIDIRVDSAGKPAFIEINTLPGLNRDHSDLPMIAYAAGLTYEELLARIIDSALKRAGTGKNAPRRTRSS